MWVEDVCECTAGKHLLLSCTDPVWSSSPVTSSHSQKLPMNFNIKSTIGLWLHHVQSKILLLFHEDPDPPWLVFPQNTVSQSQRARTIHRCFYHQSLEDRIDILTVNFVNTEYTLTASVFMHECMKEQGTEQSPHSWQERAGRLQNAWLT